MSTADAPCEVLVLRSRDSTSYRAMCRAHASLTNLSPATEEGARTTFVCDRGAQWFFLVRWDDELTDGTVVNRPRLEDLTMINAWLTAQLRLRPEKVVGRGCIRFWRCHGEALFEPLTVVRRQFGSREEFALVGGGGATEYLVVPSEVLRGESPMDKGKGDKR